MLQSIIVYEFVAYLQFAQFDGEFICIFKFFK